MCYKITRGFALQIVVVSIFCGLGCKKEFVGEAKVIPPVRTYFVIARIDKKETNSSSEGTAVLIGLYDEGTKVLNYSLEYKDVTPQLITLRSGPKGSAGNFIKELYNRDKQQADSDPITGSMTLSSLQERNLLKGQWFVAVNTTTMSPEISGFLTLKQK